MLTPQFALVAHLTLMHTMQVVHPVTAGSPLLAVLPIPHPPMLPADIPGLQAALMTQLTALQNLAKAIAVPIMLLGCVFLGIMYTGAIIPGLKSWKDAHPTAASTVMLGIVILSLAPAVVSNIQL